MTRSFWAKTFYEAYRERGGTFQTAMRALSCRVRRNHLLLGGSPVIRFVEFCDTSINDFTQLFSFTRFCLLHEVRTEIFRSEKNLANGIQFTESTPVHEQAFAILRKRRANARTHTRDAPKLRGHAELTQ